jgi:hypothetical protein
MGGGKTLGPIEPFFSLISQEKQLVDHFSLAWLP